MLKRSFFLLASLAAATAYSQQQPATYKSAVVALTEDAALRRSFETEVAAIAKSRAYDAVTSYDITSDVQSLDTDAFLEALAARGIQAVLMVRPAAVGEGASLESVRNEVSSRTFSDMQRFARRPSGPGSDDLIAVAHLAIYTLVDRKPELVSAGAGAPAARSVVTDQPRSSRCV